MRLVSHFNFALIGFLFVVMAACSTSNAGNHESVLSMPGNDVFGAIKEAVNKLLNAPDTDWNMVDTEALRQHLIDMKNFTENVTVIEKVNIDNGVFIKIQPDAEALASVERAMAAHPAQLFAESGWTMVVEKQGDIFNLTITTDIEKEVSMIRGLGYIGLMAFGSHHANHHWMMVQGINAHH